MSARRGGWAANMFGELILLNIKSLTAYRPPGCLGELSRFLCLGELSGWVVQVTCLGEMARCIVSVKCLGELSR